MNSIAAAGRPLFTIADLIGLDWPALTLKSEMLPSHSISQIPAALHVPDQTG